MTRHFCSPVHKSHSLFTVSKNQHKMVWNGFLTYRASGRYPKPVNRNDRLHANFFSLSPEHRFVHIADNGSADGVIVDVAFLTMFRSEEHTSELQSRGHL